MRFNPPLKIPGCQCDCASLNIPDTHIAEIDTAGYYDNGAMCVRAVHSDGVTHVTLSVNIPEHVGLLRQGEFFLREGGSLDHLTSALQRLGVIEIVRGKAPMRIARLRQSATVQVLLVLEGGALQTAIATAPSVELIVKDMDALHAGETFDPERIWRPEVISDPLRFREAVLEGGRNTREVLERRYVMARVAAALRRIERDGRPADELSALAREAAAALSDDELSRRSTQQ